MNGNLCQVRRRLRQCPNAAGFMRVREVALFGAPLDTGNRGVEALGLAAVDGVLLAGPGTRIAVFDNGWGVRRPADEFPGADVELVGVRLSRRVHRPESWARVGVSQRLGLSNPIADRLRTADVILDISGGDSFSDVYGLVRFNTVLAPKRAAMRAGRPMVLLPQTYGPYQHGSSRRASANVLTAATMAWARDAESYEVMLDLLGENYDPGRHRQGVDIAFGLRPRDPAERLPTRLRDVLDSPEEGPVVGLNISGLLANDSHSAERFGLALAYREVMARLLERLVDDGARVLIVPHVRGHGGESDMAASRSILDGLPRSVTERVDIVPDSLDARELKWVISHCAWFCGARMHATIAALSTGVPAAAVAYTMKFRGVFATCGAQDHVVEARSTATGDAVERLIQSFEARDQTRDQLRSSHLPVVAASRQQIADSLAACTAESIPR